MINEWLEKLPAGEYPWLWKVFLAVLATALVNYLTGKALDRLQTHLERTHNVWDDALLASIRRPAYWMIWLVGFSYALQLILQTSDAEIFTVLNSLRAVLAVLILTWFLVGLVGQIEQRLLSGEYTKSDEPFDPTTVMALGKLVMLPGDPGLGKSFITLDMAARVSTGAPWPDRPSSPPPIRG